MTRIGRGNKRTSVTDDQILAMLAEGHPVKTVAYQLGVWTQRVRQLHNSSKWQPTRLNLRTSARFDRCQQNGGCVPSGRFVSRTFANGDLDLPLCRRCGVPIWSREIRTMVTSRERAKEIQRRKVKAA